MFSFFLLCLCALQTCVCLGAKVSVVPSETRGFTLVNVRSHSSDGSSTLHVDEEGLRFLRSEALKSTPLRLLGIVGPARSGKSFFLNSILGKQSFEVSSGDEGHTKGIWVQMLPDSDASIREGSSTAEDAEGGRCQEELVWSAVDGTCATATVTLLVDSEGLDSIGANEVHDAKLVTLTAMISSSFFYNSMRKIDQRDLEVLADMIDFKEMFSNNNMTKLDLVEGDVVFLVQSYSNTNEECQSYPSKFIRNQQGNKVMQFLSSPGRCNRIFCLTHPNRKVEEGDLLSLEYADLDISYRQSISTIRSFIRSVDLKRGILKDSPMTGGQLADLLETVVPALNEIRVPARALISLHADVLSRNISDWALDLFETRSNPRATRNLSCSRQPSVHEDFKQITRESLSRFDRNMAELPTGSIDGLPRLRRDLEEKLMSHADFSAAKVKADWKDMCFPIKHVQVLWDCQVILIYLFPCEAILSGLQFNFLALATTAVLDFAQFAALVYRTTQYLHTESVCHYVNLFGRAVAGDFHNAGELQRWCTFVSTPLLDWTRTFVDHWVEYVSPTLISSYTCGEDAWIHFLGLPVHMFYATIVTWVIFWNLQRLYLWIKRLLFPDRSTNENVQPSWSWMHLILVLRSLCCFLSGAMAMHFYYNQH
jgi:hypothetical protein